MDNDRWMVVKGNVPMQICNSIEEAEDIYHKYDCDEIRRVDGSYEPPVILEPRQP